MFSAKNYKFGFDVWGLALFLAVMLPNFIWFAVPAPNDVLRANSATPTLDAAAQIFQVIMTAALCAVINTSREKPMRTAYKIIIAALVAAYYGGWAAYYLGAANAAVILDLVISPCAAFAVFSFAVKNAPALISAGVFSLCHLIFGAVNFL